MTETTTLGLIFSAVGALLFGLLGIVWGMLQSRQSSSDAKILALEVQNKEQAIDIARLKENARGREEAHAQHREDITATMSDLKASIAELGRKIDRLTGQGTPFPGRYGQRPGDSGERK